MKIILLCLLLAGCNTLPSFRYCDKVNYTRNGSEIKISADCRAPIGGI